MGKVEGRVESILPYRTLHGVSNFVCGVAEHALLSESSRHGADSVPPTQSNAAGNAPYITVDILWAVYPWRRKASERVIGAQADAPVYDRAIWANSPVLCVQFLPRGPVYLPFHVFRVYGHWVSF